MVILGLTAVLLQYRMWVSDRGMPEVRRLQAQIDAQALANRVQRERNRQLAAEVGNLKEGMAAVEERARSELGMVAKTETFYQVVRARGQSLPAAGESALPSLTARAQ